MAQPPTASAPDSFGARSTLTVGDRTYRIARIGALADRFDVDRLPYSIKVVLENLLRHEDGVSVRPADIEAVADWGATPGATAWAASDPPRSPSPPSGSSCRTSPASPAWSTWPPCATPWPTWAATRPR